jgi:hypothetical protein
MKHRATFSCLVVVAGLALIFPSMAQAQCAAPNIWNLRGRWALSQSNGFDVHLFVWQAGHQLSGWAQTTYPRRDGPAAPFGADWNPGRVTGTIEGDDLAFTIEWRNGPTGVYRGAVTSEGKLVGKSQDRPYTAAIWSNHAELGAILNALCVHQ